MQLGERGKTASILAGTMLALFGAGFLGIAVVGDFVRGQSVAIAIGSGLLLAALPALIYPFSARLAKHLLVPLLLVLAAVLLWLVFRPSVPVARPGIYQAGAIAFAVLLLARVGLALRGNRSRLGT